jgi:hypothetical protein
MTAGVSGLAPLILSELAAAHMSPACPNRPFGAGDPMSAVEGKSEVPGDTQVGVHDPYRAFDLAEQSCVVL